MEELKPIMEKFVASGWDLIAIPAQDWLDGKADMENSNMKGHWVGIFTSIDDKTEIDFTEQVTAKKFYMKPFVKSYLKKQQTQFVMDLKRILEK